MDLDIGGLIVSAAVRPQQGQVIYQYLVAELSVSISVNACRLNGTNLIVLPLQNSLRTFLELPSFTCDSAEIMSPKSILVFSGLREVS